VIYLLKYHKNPQVLRRRSIEKKKREKVLKKGGKEKKEKRGRKRKAPESLQIKGKSIF
jgi:hypothetical protein